ncbi:rough deal protein C-terminal region-domain-containing protein, partial [Blyttiomyces helicus]
LGSWKVDTLATITQAGDETTDASIEFPACSAMATSRGFCLAVDRQLHLMNGSLSEHYATLTLDDAPEAIAFSRDSMYMVAGDSSRTVHFIHAESGTILLSHELPDDEDDEEGDATDAKTFAWLGFIGRPGDPPRALSGLPNIYRLFRDTEEELLVLLSNLTLIRFSRINLVKLEHALTSGDYKAGMEVKGAIKIEIVNLREEKSIIQSVRNIVPCLGAKQSDERLLIVGNAREPLSVWRRSELDGVTSRIDGVSRALLGCELRKAEVDPSGRYLVLLDERRQLSIWDLENLIALYRYEKTDIVDFCIMKSTSSPIARASTFNILALLDIPGTPSAKSIQVVNLPSFEVTYSVPVSSDCWLVHCDQKWLSTKAIGQVVTADGESADPEGAGQNVYFIEGHRKHEYSRMSLSIRAIAETIPTFRFQQLIRTKRFEEASLFAEHFGLDFQYVSKAKLTHMLVDLRARTEWTTVNADELVAGFLEDLSRVTDDSFCIDFCLRAVVPTHHAVYSLLSYARSLVQDIEKKEDTTATPGAALSVHQAIRRLGTYQLVASVRNSFDGADWQRFRVSEMSDEMRQFVCDGDMQKAIIVWRRHHLGKRIMELEADDMELGVGLKAKLGFPDEQLLESIEDILADIPDDMPPNDFVPWLRHEVLPVRIAVWIERRARIVEMQEKRPHNALHVIRLLDTEITSLEEDGPRANLGAHLEIFSPPTPACHVKNTILYAQISGLSTFGFESSVGRTAATSLMGQLEDLVYLWDEIAFKVPLSNYSQTSPSTIATEILARVAAPELLHDAIEKYFRPYVKRNDLNCEELLVEYCIEYMATTVPAKTGTSLSGPTLSGAPWEARVLAIVESMQTLDAKVDVVLEVMTRTSIPWSEPVGKLFTEALQWPALRRTVDLKETYGLLRVRLMLLSYGITSFNMSDKRRGKGLLYQILERTDKVLAMDDALQVVRMYHHLSKMDAYKIRLINLCEGGLSDRALNLLKHGTEDPSLQPSNASKAKPAFEVLTAVDGGLTRVQTIGVAKEVVTYLVEVMDGFVTTSHTDLSDEDKTTFRRAVDAAVAISTLASAIRQDLLIDGERDRPDRSVHASSASSSTDQVTSRSTLSAYPLAAAADPAILSVEDPATSLCAIRSLFVEFHVAMGLAEYDNHARRREVLNEFATKAFRYAGEEPVAETKGKGKGKGSASTQRREPELSQTALYRIAELLGFERSSLRGILAEEAARNGDFRTSLVLCREMYDKFPQAETARVLRNVARLLTNYAATNKKVYRDAKESKMNIRLTSSILLLSQQALSICGENIIHDCLDDFKNYELQHRIFTQCDAGDYDAVVSKDGFSGPTDPFRSTPRDFSSSSSSSSSSGSSSAAASSSSSFNLRTLSSLPARTGREIELANIGDRYAASLFDEHYREKALVLATERAMGLAATFVLDVSASASEPPSSSSEKSTKKKAKAISRPANSGRVLGDFLRSNQSLQTALRVWHRATEAELRDGDGGSVGNEESHVYFKTLMSLVDKILSSRTIDQKLALECLLELPQEMAFQAFNEGLTSATTEYPRLMRIAAVGISAGTAWNQLAFRGNAQEIAANGKWWHQLRLLDVPFDHNRFQRKDMGHLRMIIPTLLKQTGCDLLTALEYARSYNIDEDLVLLEYLRQQIVDPPADSEGNGIGYQTRVVGVVDEIANRGALLQVLEACVEVLSSYDYERIRFTKQQILRIASENDVAKRGIVVLDVLMDYSRNIQPKLDELETNYRRINATHSKPEQLTLEALLKIFPKSAQRLPFHAIMEKGEKIIHDELTEESLSRLIPLSVPLELDADNFYMAVLQNIFQKPPTMTPGEVFVPKNHSGNPIHYADVSRFVARIANPEVATRACVQVGGSFPCGTDRIAAYKHALNFAKTATGIVPSKKPDGKKDSADASVVVKRVELLIKATETENQFRLLGLDELIPELGKSSEVEIISKLYITRSEAALKSKGSFDLHHAVDDFAKRYGIDIAKLRLNLIATWLAEEVVFSEAEKRMYLPSMRVQINNMCLSRSEAAIQMRLLYVITAMELEKGITCLRNWVGQASTKVSTFSRVRAISVLFQLASANDLKNAGVDYTVLKKYMQTLLYLADFEELQIVQTTKDFDACDKEALARSLWVNHRDEPKVVQLICNICLDYEIHDATLWQNALHRLYERGLYRYLLGILEHISSIPDLARMNSLPHLWNAIMLGCLRDFGNDIESHKVLYYRVISLIHKCPFVPELDVPAFVQLFRSLAMDASMSCKLAALRGIAALPPSSETLVPAKDVLTELDTDKLVQVLGFLRSKYCESDGLTDLSGMWIGKNWLRNAVYDVFDERGNYGALPASEFRLFVRYLVHEDKIDSILIASLRNGQFSSALDLVDLYYEIHPNRAPSSDKELGEDGAADEGVVDAPVFSKQQLLQMYLDASSIGPDDRKLAENAQIKMQVGEISPAGVGASDAEQGFFSILLCTLPSPVILHRAALVAGSQWTGDTYSLMDSVHEDADDRSKHRPTDTTWTPPISFGSSGIFERHGSRPPRLIGRCENPDGDAGVGEGEAVEEGHRDEVGSSLCRSRKAAVCRWDDDVGQRGVGGHFDEKRCLCIQETNTKAQRLIVRRPGNSADLAHNDPIKRVPVGYFGCSVEGTRKRPQWGSRVDDFREEVELDLYVRRHMNARVAAGRYSRRGRAGEESGRGGGTQSKSIRKAAGKMSRVREMVVDYRQSPRFDHALHVVGSDLFSEVTQTGMHYSET